MFAARGRQKIPGGLLMALFLAASGTLSSTVAEPSSSQASPAKKSSGKTTPRRAPGTVEQKQGVATTTSTVKKVQAEPPVDTQDFLDQGVLENDDIGELGITGMMNDETITKFGHEFFEAFTKTWRPLVGVNYNIRIGERYDPLRGSLIHVMINNNSVYEGFLTPRQEAIEELATQLSHELRATLKNRVPIDEELY